MRGRPMMQTNYAQQRALLGTNFKRGALAGGFLFLLILPSYTSSDTDLLFARMFMLAIGAIGLNVVAGYAGQLSLAHACFLGIGAFTAAVVSGPTDGRHIGLGVDEILIWLPIAGLVPALIARVVGPVAMRVRGLYFAVLTVGLVYLGLYAFDELDRFTGGLGRGRGSASASLFGWDLTARGMIPGLPFDRAERLYFLALIVATIVIWAVANLLRSAPGRAFAAVRDKDLAAELIGVELGRTKVLAFTISAFCAGICGALLSLLTATVTPDSYDLHMSIQFLAIILIGGMGSVAGSVIGAAFVTLMPKAIEQIPRFTSFIEEGSTGGILSTAQLEIVVYGALIVAVTLTEPRGAFGLWVRIRNYFKAWPFSH